MYAKLSYVNEDASVAMTSSTESARKLDHYDKVRDSISTVDL